MPDDDEKEKTEEEEERLLEEICADDWKTRTATREDDYAKRAGSH